MSLIYHLPKSKYLLWYLMNGQFEVFGGIRKSRKLAKEKGILALPDPKCGKKLSNEVVSAVVDFCNDDEYSRQMPGKKDCFSVGKNVCKQKRHILCNLKELYVPFKNTNPEMKIGFLKFCTLRLKYCFLAGASGTHSVCVCTIHQNVKLLLQPIDAAYKELLS